MSIDGGWRKTGCAIAADFSFPLEVVTIGLQTGDRMPGQVHHIQPIDKALDPALLVFVGIVRHQNLVAEFYRL